jgi:hypothetical protein
VLGALVGQEVLGSVHPQTKIHMGERERLVSFILGVLLKCCIILSRVLSIDLKLFSLTVMGRTCKNVSLMVPSTNRRFSPLVPTHLSQCPTITTRRLIYDDLLTTNV